MTIKELVKVLSEREDGKSKVKIGDIREIISIMSDIFYADDKAISIDTYRNLLINGKRRANKNK